MTGKKSFMMLLTILLISLGIMIFIGGTEPHSSYVNTVGGGVDSDVPSEAAPVETKVVVVRVSVGAETFARLREWNNKFMEDHSGLRIDLQYVDPAEAYASFREQLRSGGTADVVLLDNAWIGEWATAGLLLPVDEFFKGDEQAQHFPTLMRQVSWNGYIWAVPNDVDPYVLVWNEEALREVGRTYPPRSADELEELEHALRTQDRIGLYADMSDPFALASYLAATGKGGFATFELPQGQGEDAVEPEVTDAELANSELANEEWSDAELADPDAGEEATATFEATTISTEGGTAEGGAAAGNGADRDLNFFQSLEEVGAPWDALTEGKIAMLIAPYSDYRRFANHRLQLLPVNWLHSQSLEQGAKGWLKGTSYAVTASSDQKAAALEWIRYMTSEEVQLDLMTAGGGLPANVDVYRSDSYRNLSFYEELLIAIEQGATFPVHPDLPTALRNYSTESLERLRAGEWTDETLLLFSGLEEAPVSAGTSRETYSGMSP